MKIFLYMVLALGVLFDIGAGTYLWHLLGERKSHRIEASTDHGESRQSPRQIKSSSSRSRPTYAIY